MRKLELEVLNLHVKVDRILDILTNQIGVNCSKMGSHINFVETVYESIRNPLGYICSKIASFSSHNIVDLPRISHPNVDHEIEGPSSL